MDRQALSDLLNATTVWDSALAARQLGWPVFPLRHKEKIPLAGSKGFIDATTDLQQLKDWFSAWDYYNIGLPTGKPTGTVVIDIDENHGGKWSWLALKEAHNIDKATPTLVVKTANGWHLYYELPAEVDIAPSAGKLGKGLDIRGTGGYVVFPPSVHPSEKKYQFVFDRQTIIAPLPAWIMLALREKPSVPQTMAYGPVIPMGQRNEAAAKVAGFFRRFGFTADQIYAHLKILPFEQPMPDWELNLIAKSISRYTKEHDFSGSNFKIDITTLEKEL